MALNKIIFAIAIISLTACGTSKVAEGNKEQSGAEQTPAKAGEIIIWVNSFKSDCDGNDMVNYFYQTQEGTYKPDGNWDCLYKNIEGFEFEPGYIYQLEVAQKIVEGIPSLFMTQIVSKKRDPDYFRIYDIWAATHMNSEALDVSATRPNIEVNLTTMKIIGKGMCNQYFGKIKRFTTSILQFGAISGTKMMCPEIKQEGLFLMALKETESYEIKSMTLRLFNSDHKEVLRFQKVD